jgi:hypothetical protein
MKSKRRHELQTNVLADQLGHWIERVRPFTTTFLLLAVAAVLVLAAWYFFAVSHEKKLAESWRSYMLAGTNPQGDIVEELNLVTEQFDDTQAGQWAALTSADIESSRGVRLMFTDRAAAETSLNMAKNRFREVLNSKHAAKDAMLLRRAHFGLAQVYEAQGELDDAKQQYATVAESDKDSALGKAAQKRADQIETAATKKWYNWFANQKPAPRSLGTGTSPPGSPDTDLNVLPESPGTDFMKDLVPSSPPAEPAPSPGATSPGEATAPTTTEAAPATTPPATPPTAPTEPSLDPPATDVPPTEAPGK